MRVHRNSLIRNLFFTRRPLREMLLELMKMCELVANLNFLKVKGDETSSLIDFSRHQAYHLRETKKRLKDFESTVVDMTAAACRATLIEEGFSPDKYPEEMEFYMRQLEGIKLRGRTLNTITEMIGSS